jgi:hypothetical protein
MQVVARPTWAELEWATPLWRAHAAGTLPATLAPPRRIDVDGAPRVDRALLAALADEAPASDGRVWRALASPGAGVVVTGQQPGAVGGPLLVLYKVATAVALARRLAAHRRAPVVPLFWNAGDDDDFDEVARVGWMQADERLAFIELPRRGHAGWVGDLPAALDTEAADAVLADAPAVRRTFVPERARDHGDWVSSFLHRVFPELAIVDGRSAALRRAATPLFERYLGAADAVRAAVESQLRAVVAHGAAPTLGAESLRMALHLTPERRRTKLGSDLAPLHQALADAPHTVSPNVLLRALVQDALLPTLAHVVGPAELGYLIELRPARAALGVAEPALVPRLGATLVPKATWQALDGIAPAAWLGDPRAVLAAQAAAPQAPGLDAAFDALGRGLDAEEVPARTRRKLDALRAEVATVRRDAARAAWIATRPALAALETWVRPRGKPQERVLAGLWFVARRGERAAADLLGLADAHLDGLDAGAGMHPVALLDAEP